MKKGWIENFRNMFNVESMLRQYLIFKIYEE